MLASFYLQCVTGVIVRGLVFKGLAQKQRALVVDLIPVFAIAHVQGGFNVAGALLMPEVDLRKKPHSPQQPNLITALCDITRTCHPMSS